MDFTITMFELRELRFVVLNHVLSLTKRVVLPDAVLGLWGLLVLLVFIIGSL